MPTQTVSDTTKLNIGESNGLQFYVRQTSVSTYAVVMRGKDYDIPIILDFTELDHAGDFCNLLNRMSIWWQAQGQDSVIRTPVTLEDIPIPDQVVERSDTDRPVPSVPDTIQGVRTGFDPEYRG